MNTRLPNVSSVDVFQLTEGIDGELITWDSSGLPATVAAGTSGQLLTSNGAGSAPTFQTAAIATLIQDADQNTKIQVEESPDENIIRFDTAGVERVVIDATGRFGLGTSSPQKNFHLQSTVPTMRLSDSNASTDQQVATLFEMYRGNNTNRVAFLGMESSGTDTLGLATDYTAGIINFSTGNNVLALAIDASQNSDFQAGNITTTGTAATGALTVTGTADISDDIIMADDKEIRTSTSDGADNESVALGGGGAASSLRGAFIKASGNEDTNTGTLFLTAGNVVGGEIKLSTGSSNRIVIAATGEIDFKAGNLITTGTFESGDIIAKGINLTVDTNQIVLDSDAGGGATTTLTDSATAARVITFPDATDTLVGKATTDTLTNKTLTDPVLSDGTVTADGSVSFDRTNEDLSIGDGSASQIVHMGAWKTWTPTLTNITLGNGTIVSRYTQVGKLVHAEFRFVLGSTSAIGTNPRWSPPVTMATNLSSPSTLGNVHLQDTGTAQYLGDAIWDTSTTIQMKHLNSSAFLKQTTATVPFTWTTNDIISCHITYEAA